MIKIARPEIRSDIRPDISSLDISNPILMTSTLNPNDMDGHRSLDHQPSLMAKQNMSAPNASTNRNKQEPGNKITFKDLKRYTT